ncbi:hypothetical protein BKA70DRAFT_1230949 [Coprinopsis sp. MPI-PUGE-AT-0042]|nr:hypothetical protein BKA70DRAFT_1230949 [Coprinopsis sp. MPI-PUGE-AT-0042]
MAPAPHRYEFQFASLAMLYYDYLLTLQDEIHYVWRARWRLSTLFYIFCRYALLANLVYYISIAKGPEILEVSQVSCHPLQISPAVIYIFGHIGIISVWGLRTYAVCNKNKYMLALLFLSGSTTIILLLIRAPFNRCTGTPRFQYIRGGVSVSMLFFDTTSCLFATVRAWRTRRDFESASLTAIVFSQGLTYIAYASHPLYIANAYGFPVPHFVSLWRPLSSFGYDSHHLA